MVHLRPGVVLKLNVDHSGHVMPNSEAHDEKALPFYFRSSPDKDRGPVLQHLQAREFQQCLVGLLSLP